MQPDHNHPEWVQQEADEYRRTLHSERIRTRLWIAAILLILIAAFLMGAHGFSEMTRG